MICRWERGVSCSGPASNANAWEPIGCSCWLLRMQRNILLSDLDCCPMSRCGWATNMFLYVFVQPTDLSVTHQDSWLPLSIEIDQKPGRKFRLGLMGALLQQRGRITNSRFPCLLTPPEGWAGSLQGVRWECVQRLAQRVGRGGVPTPLVVVCAGTLFLLLAPQKWQFCILLSTIRPNYPYAHSYF